MLANGNWSKLNPQRGALIEFANTATPLALYFDFNPTTLSRTRSVTVRTGGAPGTHGGYDFQNRTEAVRASQGVTVNAESFSIKILLDATDRMNAGDPSALQNGIQPELDIIRSMVEPKMQTPGGARTLAAIGHGHDRAFSRHQFASVLLFQWGPHLLPVFMTQAQVDLKEFLPTLFPYRAEATLTLQLIESNNPFYVDELKRQFASAGQAPGPNPGPAPNLRL
ncbi:MAG: hypothetical protein U1F76_31325 [Candidatus Competibacteraceae bacterium]